MPSEYGIDPARMLNAIEQGRDTFEQKMAVRKAIEEANIPFTYVSANCFAGYFAANLSQMHTLVPPAHQVTVYGDGNVKGNPPNPSPYTDYSSYLNYCPLPHFFLITTIALHFAIIYFSK